MNGPNHDLIATPHANEAERAVLATALIDATSLGSIWDTLKTSHFFSSEHAEAYSAMLELRKEEKPIDALLLSGKLREKHGFSEQEAALRVSGLINGGFKVANVQAYAWRIIEAEKRRSVLQMLPEIERLVSEGKSLEDVSLRLRMEADCLNLKGRKKLVSLRADELLERVIPVREMLLSPIIPSQSLSMLYAKRGIGKTFLGLGVAHAVASGSNFLRWEASTPRRVLYVDGELPGRLLQERYRIVSGNAPSSNLQFISPDFQDSAISDLALRDGQALIEAHLDSVTLLILDNLSCLVRGVKENEGEGWLPIQGWALDLRRQGISVLFLHHAGKQGTQRGTSRREDVLDTVITLRNPSDYRAEEGLRVELHFEKCRSLTGEDVRPFEVKLESRMGAVEWTMRDVEDATKARALELLAAGWSRRDVADEIGVSKSTVQRWGRFANVPCPNPKEVGQRDSEECGTPRWDEPDLEETKLVTRKGLSRDNVWDTFTANGHIHDQIEKGISGDETSEN